MSTTPLLGMSIIPPRELDRRLSIGRSTRYAYLDERSPRHKPSFPKPARQGSRIGFLEHEVDAYIAGLMQAREG